jgi:hypothetical protein
MASRRLLVLLLLLRLGSPGGVQAGGQQTKPEMNQYDEGGTFRITLDVPPARRSKISGEMDAFIWEHWSGHQRAKLRIIAQTREGVFTFQTIFIEPDAHGLWRMRDEWHPDPRPGKSAVTVDEYDEIHRIDVNTGKMIPNSEKRATGTYKLLIANKSRGLETPF